MEDYKQWYKSKTMIGLLITLLAGIAQATGFTVGVEDQAALTDMVVRAVELGGIAFAAYGRIKATKELSS